jgi:hypothetical protein
MAGTARQCFDCSRSRRLSRPRDTTSFGPPLGGGEVVAIPHCFSPDRRGTKMGAAALKLPSCCEPRAGLARTILRRPLRTTHLWSSRVEVKQSFISSRLSAASSAASVRPFRKAATLCVKDLVFRIRDHHGRLRTVVVPVDALQGALVRQPEGLTHPPAHLGVQQPSQIGHEVGPHKKNQINSQ